VLVASLLAAVPARAAEANEATGAFRASTLTTLSEASRVVLQQPARKSDQTQTATPGDGQAFFKTPKGALTLALIGAGVGYALYSKVHDRVASPIR
jgi:hypothetical protein